MSEDEEFKSSTFMKKMPEDGDCFYNSIVNAFLLSNDDVRNYDQIISEKEDDGIAALRRTVAMAITEEIYKQFKSFGEAGLYDYKFMSSIDSLISLRKQIMLSGSDVGPRESIWANEFEIEVVCNSLQICCLIYDTSSKNKFIKVGKPEDRFVIVCKTGDHYNLLYGKEEDGMKRGIQSRRHLSRRALRKWKI